MFLEIYLRRIAPLATIVASTWLSACGAQAPSDQASITAEVGPGLELLTETAAKLLVRDGQIRASTTALANALPKDKSPLDVLGGQYVERYFRKIQKSATGLANLIIIDYQISYQYAQRYQNHGYYITNLFLTPRCVWTDSFYDVNMEAKAQEAVNIGTAADPRALLRFAVTFSSEPTAGSADQVTDTFELDGRTGALTPHFIHFDQGEFPDEGESKEITSGQLGCNP